MHDAPGHPGGALLGAFDFLDISQLEVSQVVYLALVLTVLFLGVALGIAWLWRKWRR